MTHKQEKNQFTEVDPEMTERVEKDVTIPGIDVFRMQKDFKKNMHRVRKERRHKHPKCKLQ